MAGRDLHDNNKMCYTTIWPTRTYLLAIHIISGQMGEFVMVIHNVGQTWDPERVMEYPQEIPRGSLVILNLR